jgi:pimeloyl-ACP methyl ester carboxylesterase
MGFKKAKDGSLTTWTLQRKQFNNTTTAAAPAGPMEQAIHTVGGQVLDAAVTATGTAAAAAAAASSLQYTQNTSKSTAQPSMVVGPQQQQQQQQHRNHDQTTQPHFIPIVLIPGLGLGVLPFLLFVRDIMKKCPNNPLILMEMPHVSLRVCRCAVEFDVVAQAAVDAVRRIGADRACFIGQSYGSFCTSRILQLFPEVVQSVVLLDPVCILTCYPRLLYNFIYRRLNITESLSVFIFDAIRYLFARDLTVSETFCRKFHWSELQIWPEDLPETSLICLSGKDTFLPATAARKQFEGRPGVTIMYHPDLGHGQMLLRTNWMSQIADRVTKMIMQQQQQQ